MEDEHYKYVTLRSLNYMHSNPFRFPISSLGLPIFLLRIAEREQWQNMQPMTTHQTDIIVTHNKSLCYFKAIYLISTSHFLITFQRPVRSSTSAYIRDSWYLWCAVASSFKIWAFFLGGRDSRCFWCAAASSSEIRAFFSGGRDSWYFRCAPASSSKIWSFFLGGRDSQCFWCAAASSSGISLFRREGLPVFLVCHSIILQNLGILLGREGLLVFLVCRSIILQNLGFLLG
jgi:hypothetical protein